jgi:hypothetical protein
MDLHGTVDKVGDSMEVLTLDQDWEKLRYKGTVMELKHSRLVIL